MNLRVQGSGYYRYQPDQKSVLAYKIEQILKSLELEKVNQNKERTIPSMVKDQELKL